VGRSHNDICLYVGGWLELEDILTKLGFKAWYVVEGSEAVPKS
jgi:hypothetical protein